MQTRLCETCSQRVSVHDDGYGTHFYLPMERRAILREVSDLLMHLSTNPNIQRLTATDALIYASTRVMVDQPALPPEDTL